MKVIFTPEQNQQHREYFMKLQSSDQIEASEAYGHIYSIFYKIVRGKVRKTIPNHHQHWDDVISDVFLKIHTKKHKFDAAYTVNNWLMRVTGNACIDYLRKLSVRETFRFYDESIKEETKEALVVEYDFNTDIYIKELRAVLDNAIDQLGPRKAQMMRKYYFEDKTSKEIGKEMNASDKTVVDYLVKGRKQLKNTIAQDPVAQLEEQQTFNL